MRKRTVVGAVVGAVAVAGIASGATALLLSGPDKAPPAHKPKATVHASPTTAEASEETYYNDTPNRQDFALTLKTTERQCFGSAGCNVTVEPNLMYANATPLDPDKTISITYEVHGDESGPVVQTMELSNQDQLHYTPVSISTASSGTKVTAVITDVEVSE
jgi:hypothetical protein